MATLNEKEMQILRDWSRKLDRPVPLHFLRSADTRSDAFQAFCSLLHETAPSIHITQEATEEQELPAFLYQKAWRFHAIPRGTELEPFLEILAFPDFQTSSLPEHLATEVKALPLPPDLQIFVSDGCPFCPGALRQIIPLVFAHPAGRATVVDCGLFPEVAEAHKVQAVPTVLVNGIYRLTGAVNLAEILELVQKVDPSQLETDALKRMLKEGQALLLAEMMLKKSLVFPAFHPLLVDPEWSVRLGAMVAVEEIAASAPELAREVLPPLWQIFQQQNASIQGDILYLTGEVGDVQWVPALKSLEGRLEEEELAGILAEALEKLAG